MLRKFIRDESATVSAEAIIAMPLLFFVFAATFMWWDGYRTAMTAQKSTFTISDLISRQDGDIDQDFIDGMNKMFAFLTNEDVADTSIRVSVVQRKAQADGSEVHELVWSHVSGTEFAPHANVQPIRSSIPRISVGNQIIIVETHLDWDPQVRAGLPDVDTYSLVATNPRSASPQFKWGNDAT